mmetsp:Transcript_56248/g.174452  ORF Transcript_56248/g.174452 Transcript_56248/m.174452 type:complete len:609 (+) Transcript_56248:89-1915(+)
MSQTEGMKYSSKVSTGLDGLDAASEAFAMSWRDLTFSVTRRSEAKARVIVDHVFGHCKPGQMMALMGPSGCGKTSLLDLLADRVSSGKREGEIKIGSVARDAATARKVVSYVMQEDALLTAFTVSETLRYSARLSLASLTAREREARVAAILAQMGLESCANTRVGDPLIKGLSGGQKRRLSIGIELLQASPILLLDEPTSGLDSTSAFQVVECLRDISRTNRAVMMSIHQASSRMYGLFDLIYLMSRGKQVYFGPAGKAPVDYFAKHGRVCPEYSNPSEFFLDIVNTDFGVKQEQVDELVEKYRSSDIAERLLADSDKGDGLADPSSATLPSKAAGPVMQFLVLLHRTLVMNVKNPYIFAVRLAMYVALSFMVGTMYWKEGTVARKNEMTEEVRASAYALLPLLFYVQAFLVFMSVAILPFFLEQRDTFRRERANGQITCLPYVLADFLASLPGLAVIAVISTLLVVLMADLNGFGHFLSNLLLSLIVAEALMHTIGAAQPHYIIGMAFGAGLFGMFMLCEGFMVPKDDIPKGWIWGYYFAFHTYSFEWFMWNQFGEHGGAFGPLILQQYDISNVDPARNAIVLVAWAVAMEIAFFLVLYVFHTGRR